MKATLIVIFFLSSALFAFPDVCIAAVSDDGLVEVHYPVEVLSSYKDRRRTGGMNVGLNLIQMIPYNFESLLGDNTLYSETYGITPINLMTLELGYKFNFVLGSLSLLLEYGTGRASTEVSGVARDLYVDKYGLKTMYVMDNLFKEPYVAPYIGASVWQMGFTETEAGDPNDYTLTTGIGMEYSAGLLLQLNWIEDWLTDGESNAALADIGLQNTYLDVFVSQHYRAQGDLAAPTATGADYGVGLRLEF